tara:strand:- start:1082 stop:1408 length:327 start_codon:yes stop_codon:yes gene_type:complete
VEIGIVISLIITNLCFIFVAFGINENNAKYLLAGYNTMSKEEKESFDLKNYLKFFKNFFINLAIYSTLFFAIFYIAFDQITALIAYCVPIVFSMPYMIYKSNKFKIKK